MYAHVFALVVDEVLGHELTARPDRVGKQRRFSGAVVDGARDHEAPEAGEVDLVKSVLLLLRVVVALFVEQAVCVCGWVGGCAVARHETRARARVHAHTPAHT